MSAYLTPEYELVDCRFKIAKNYLQTWFIVDFVSIIPFDLFVGQDDNGIRSSNANEMIRLARLSRLYKIMRLLRLFRVLKFVK